MGIEEIVQCWKCKGYCAKDEVQEVDMQDRVVYWCARCEAESDALYERARRAVMGDVV